MATAAPLRLIAILILLASAGPVSAQPAEEATAAPTMVTDRPTDSASPELVPRRTVQIELGYKFSRTDSDAGRTDAQELPDLLARFGVSRRVEVRLTATGWTFRDGPSGREDGLNDVSLGAKFALADERGRRPQMGLLADISLPVGESGFSDDYVNPKLLFLAAHGLTDRLGLTYNLGPGFITSKGDGGRQTNWNLNYAVALSGAVSGPVSLFGELYGTFAFGRDRPDRHSFQAGTTILLSRTLQLDVRGGVGLTDDVPDWLFGAGLAFRLPR